MLGACGLDTSIEGEIFGTLDELKSANQRKLTKRFG